MSPRSPANVAWHLCPPLILKSFKSILTPLQSLECFQAWGMMYLPQAEARNVTVSPVGVCSVF